MPACVHHQASGSAWRATRASSAAQAPHVAHAIQRPAGRRSGCSVDRWTMAAALHRSKAHAREQAVLCIGLRAGPGRAASRRRWPAGCCPGTGRSAHRARCASAGARSSTTAVTRYSASATARQQPERRRPARRSRAPGLLLRTWRPAVELQRHLALRERRRQAQLHHPAGAGACASSTVQRGERCSRPASTSMAWPSLPTDRPRWRRPAPSVRAAGWTPARPPSVAFARQVASM